MNGYLGGGQLFSLRKTQNFMAKIVCFMLRPFEISNLDQGYAAMILSGAEQKESLKYKYQFNRQSYLATKLLLRLCLSAVLNGLPQDWQFRKLRYGKPMLIMPSGKQQIYFNVSNTQNLVSVALSYDAPVGIDVEAINPEFPVNLLLHRLTLKEKKELLSCFPNERAERFFRIWTLKEAYMKLIGTGLHHGLDQFSVTLDPLNITPAHGAGVNIILEETNCTISQLSLEQRSIDSNLISIAIAAPRSNITWFHTTVQSDNFQFHEEH